MGARIIYSGIVQGVGFRYTTFHYAKSLGVKGWVKNLADGRVAIEVFGDQENIGKLIAMLDQHFAGSIQDKEINYIKDEGSFNDFRIVS